MTDARNRRGNDSLTQHAHALVMKKANMGRALVWSLCFGVAVTASAAAAGLTPSSEPTNPALRLAVDGRADPLASRTSDTSLFSASGVDSPGYSVSSSVREPMRLAPDVRPEPFLTDSPADAAGLGPDAADQAPRTVSLEYTLSAPAHATGFGLDLAVAPRAGVSLSPEGNQLRSVGGEVRLGKRLERMVGVSKFDSAAATWDHPSWYFFAATDGSALTWTPSAMAAGARRGLSYQDDRIVVGDAQIGLSMEAKGVQASVGFTNRSISNGKESVDENFVGASFTMRR